MRQIVAVRHEVGGERVEQLRHHRRVRVAEVVDGLDEAAADEVRPVAIDDGAREPRIVRLASSSRRARARRLSDFEKSVPSSARGGASAISRRSDIALGPPPNVGPG